MTTEDKNVLVSDLNDLEWTIRQGRDIRGYHKLTIDRAIKAVRDMPCSGDIKNRIEEILSDERLSYPTANIMTNAPLALIQLQMEVELHTLQKVIGEQRTNINALREARRKNKQP